MAGMAGEGGGHCRYGGGRGGHGRYGGGEGDMAGMEGEDMAY